MYATREVSSTLLVEDVFEPELQRGLEISPRLVMYLLPELRI